jgi:two-component system OmpR family response regulator
MTAALTSQPEVLLVEDDRDIAEVMTEVLVEAGYNTTRVRNGTEALERFSTGYRPRAMVVDYEMPDMTGLEFLHACEATFAGCALIPTLVMSAHRPDKMAAEGVRAYLQKPFTPDKLLDRLHGLLHAQDGDAHGDSGKGHPLLRRV